ncbi:site-specific integrase [Tardiphaga sp. vice352]|uniref:site-specific integrase n=1 Tax=unclassified Tardiphaga TaxID=2631404 RepID=UPI001161DC15|nr:MULTISPECIES: site-specific integrase [unclassified Tardiphaga]QDM14794.1 site-specific integrase [Tardiphaga sp. vice278]QDM24975.1 site-specific integrase [Tardiphaga sp. vice304]QDM30185.1 site-specific integrase [Tardiphaga sp. vice352]
MPLAMSRPWKHPNSGFYWLRKGVPEDLRALVGKREEKRSLLTRDPVEAKRLHAEALAELEARWANLRAGPKSLSEREAHQMAVAVHDHWLGQYRENPSSQTTWDTELGVRLFLPPKSTSPAQIYDASFLLQVDNDASRVDEMEGRCLRGADECLASQGLKVDENSRWLLAKAIAAAVQRASLTLKRLANGEAIENSFFSPSSVAPASAPVSEKPVPFQILIKGWAAERRPVEKTVYEWTRVMHQLEKFLGHDDARRVTGTNFVAWKAAMVEEGLRPKTIQDAKLAPMRAIFEWGFKNKLISANPAEGVSLEVKSKQGEKKRSFTDEEAKTILRAASASKDPVRRWVPWIGAYSGARVSEICQLRSEDVLQIDDIWCMKLDPEAGSLKTSGSERIIPVHPALIEAGFVKFASRAKSGPLFAELAPDKFGKRGGNGTKIIGRFVRQLGLLDLRLSPSHSWRHRIKTLGRRHALAKDILDAITGHGSRSVGDSYGEFPAEALYRELCKIPALKL